MISLHEKFIVDENGKKTAAVLSYSEWKKVIEILEEYDDICAYDRAKARSSNPSPFRDVVKKLKDSRK